jgi:hypothetical protein
LTLGGAATAAAQVSTSGFARNYILSRPTVSPYLNLLRNDGVSGIANYQTLVRPQIEQRELAVIQENENQRLQRQINAQQTSIDGIQRQRAQRVFSTGHQTRFLNYSDYYPGFSAARRR